MKNPRFLNPFSLTVLVSLSLISSSISAQSVNGQHPVLSEEIPIEAGPAPHNAAAQAFPEDSAPKPELLDDRATIQTFINANMDDIYGGVYTDEHGNNVILLTDTSAANQETIKAIAKFKDNVKFQQVKYTQEQLLASKEALSALAAELNLEGVGMNTKLNKVNVYITEDNYHKHKQTIQKHLDEDMVQWVFGALKVKRKLITNVD